MLTSLTLRPITSLTFVYIYQIYQPKGVFIFSLNSEYTPVSAPYFCWHCALCNKNVRLHIYEICLFQFVSIRLHSPQNKTQIEKKKKEQKLTNTFCGKKKTQKIYMHIIEFSSSFVGGNNFLLPLLYYHHHHHQTETNRN